MSLGAINKETGRATYDEILRLRQRLDTLERFRGGLTQALIRSGTDEGPVGSGTAFLRLDATNGPITGSLTFLSSIFVDGPINGSTLLLSGLATIGGGVDVTGKVTISDTLQATGAVVFGSTLNVVGDADFDANVNMDGTLQVDGLTTHSDMVHITAPSTGTACLRMDKATSFSTMSPDNTVSLTGHELWLKEDGNTASDSTSMDKWTSEAGPFSGDGFTKDTNGPTWFDAGGPNNMHRVTFSTANDHYLDSGSGHTFGGAGTGCTLFLVYRTSDAGSADQERGFVGRENTGGTRGGMRPPGTQANNTSFAFMDTTDSGNKHVVSNTLSSDPLNSKWCLVVMRKNTSNVWFNAIAFEGASTIEEANDSISDSGNMNLAAIGKDQSNNPFAGAAMSEMIGYQADIGEDNMKLVWNYLAEKYDFPTFGGGGGGGQTDFWVARDSGGTVVARLDTGPQLGINVATPLATLHVDGTAIITGQTTISNRTTISANCAITGLLTVGNVLITGTMTNFLAGSIVCENLDVTDTGTFTNTLFAHNFKPTSVQLDDDLKVRFGTAKDARIFYDGTNLILQPRNVGVGDVIIDLDGSNTIRFGAASGGYIDRATNQNLNIQRLSNGDLFLCRGGGDVVVGGNGPVAGSVLTVKTGNVNIVSPGVLEGDRFTVCFGTTLFTATKYLDVPTGGIATATYGFIAQRAGSILGIGWNHNAAVIIADDDLTYAVRVAGSTVLSDTEDSSVVSARVTQLRGADTFNAGDVINVHVTAGGSFNGTIGITTNVDILYDD